VADTIMSLDVSIVFSVDTMLLSLSFTLTGKGKTADRVTHLIHLLGRLLLLCHQHLARVNILRTVLVVGHVRWGLDGIDPRLGLVGVADFLGNGGHDCKRMHSRPS
jgi:hypothetical protein